MDPATGVERLEAQEEEEDEVMPGSYSEGGSSGSGLRRKKDQVHHGEDQARREEDQVHLGEDENFESAEVRQRMIPVKPRDQREIDEHEASGHAQYRAWCKFCVEAFGISHQHKLVDGSADEVPTIHSDFY